MAGKEGNIMKHPTITKVSHLLMDKLIDKSMTGVDMTVGKGNDIDFLCERCGFVYGFDIQKQAIEITADRLQNYSNYKLINDDHVNILDYINEPIDFAVYNLGYLPGFDKSITTNAETTLQSLRYVFELLKPFGWVLICFYPGHEQGRKELDIVEEFLSSDEYLVSMYQTKIVSSPVLYLISKK